MENKKYRLELLRQRHKLLHATIEALEAENAPESSVKRSKAEKLKIKDEISKLESQIENVD